MDKPDKPKVFIGSSSEGADMATVIQEALSNVSECTVWNQGLFELGNTTLMSLASFLDRFDFAIFLTTPDDKIDIRGAEFSAARDNIIFEMGLFMGGVGVDRVVFVTASNLESFRLPSDLAGVTHVTYESDRSDGNVAAALAPACQKIRQHIASRSDLHLRRAKRRPRSIYVGAICFRRSAEAIQYLLVGSDRGRTIFPKGNLAGKDEHEMEGAARLAKKEAGARGRMIEKVSRHVNYYNEELSAVHRIEVFLLETTQVIEVETSFRAPTWYGLDVAITKITSGRDYNTSYELARLLEWAEEQISAYFSKVGNSSA